MPRKSRVTKVSDAPAKRVRKKQQPVQLVTASITRHQYMSFEEMFTEISEEQRIAIQQIARRLLVLASQPVAQSA